MKSFGYTLQFVGRSRLGRRYLELAVDEEMLVYFYRFHDRQLGENSEDAIAARCGHLAVKNDFVHGAVRGYLDNAVMECEDERCEGEMLEW